MNSGQPDDAVLVERARAGDREAFDALARRHRPLAERVAFGMIAQRELAAELAQEALLQAYLSLGQLRAPGQFRSWLYGIVLNICRSHLRREARGPLSLEELVGGLRADDFRWPEPVPDPAEIAEARDVQQRVRAALAELTPADREAARLFYYEQYSLRETAALLGISVTAVKARLHKARRRLRERLGTLASPERAAGPPAQAEEGVPMVRMTIADIVRRPQEDGVQHIVVLLDEAGRRALPIWIGPAEAIAIALALRQVPSARPLTVAFMARLVAAAGASVEAVAVSALKEMTFYATVRLRRNGSVEEIDARPSDALGLAAATGAPIEVAEDVLAMAGAAVPAGAGTVGQGLTTIVEEISRQMEAAQARWRAAEPEDNERKIRALLAEVFGAGEPE
jgi:RNA polymerase sigma factor (sigma-70 family)